MNDIYIKNGNVMLNDRIERNLSIAIRGSKIVRLPACLNLKNKQSGRLRPATGGPRNDETVVIDAKGCFISPGFIDSHIHGEPEDIFRNEARYGTTAFVVAQSCAPLGLIYKRAERINEFIKSSPLGPNVLGVRLEGPYISKVKAGAQDKTYIKKIGTDTIFPNANLRKMVSVPIFKMMTIAPELRGAIPLIKMLHRSGVTASIGHSDATYEEAIEGIDAGITHATHTFNAMSGLDRREPGVVGAVLLDDRVTAEIILDLVHVHKALFGLLLKAKNMDKVIIVTDSIRADVEKECEIASSASGLLAMTKEASGLAMTGGVYRFKDGRLAGSALTMIQALKNAVNVCGVPLLDAIRMITLNPARLLGVEKSKGSIATGKDADIVVFDKDFDVKMTLVRGKIAYCKRVF